MAHLTSAVPCCGGTSKIIINSTVIAIAILVGVVLVVQNFAVNGLFIFTILSLRVAQLARTIQRRCIAELFVRRFPVAVLKRRPRKCWRESCRVFAHSGGT